MKNIYGKFLRRKKLYYFLKYYYIVTQITTNELISLLNENIENYITQYILNNYDEQKENFKIYSNKYINSYSQLIPNSNSSIANLKIDDNNSSFIKTERISIKNDFQSNNFKKFNTKFINNNDNKKHIDMLLKKSALSYKNINDDKKNIKNRRTLSYGNFEVNMSRDNNIYKIFPNEDNNNTFDNSNILNNTQSLKAIFPSYTITSPNGLMHPIFFENNNENYINNNTMNNNIEYNYQGNISFNPNISRKTIPKPSFWYGNAFSPINPIPIIQDNNYTMQMPKYLNSSTNFNSIQSINNINNNYTKDYLNKHIYDFINANNKIKQNIISNISKKHNIKLDKSNGAIKLNHRSNTLNYNGKNMKKNKNTYLKMNTDENNKMLLDRSDKEKSGKVSKDKKFKNNYKNKQKLLNGKETNDKSDLIIDNDINSPSDLIINKYKKKQNLKIDHYDNSYNNGNSHFRGKYQKKINSINHNYIHLRKNKITKSNYSIEKQNSFSYNIQKLNQNKKIFKKNSKNNKYNEDNLYKAYNIKDNSDSKHLINNNYNSINLINNNKKIMQIKGKNYLIKKNKNNYKSQNISNNSCYIKTKNVSIPNLHSNDNKKIYGSIQYEISSVVSEEFINKNNIEVNEEEQNKDDNISLRMSLQSINDSKMLELANNYVDDGNNFDLDKINDILNDKNSQKIMKKYK